MEPMGTEGHFGYFGRDYYSEVSGIVDVYVYETFPADCYILVRKGERLYMHCYASNFSGNEGYFNHMMQLLYW